MGRCAGCCRIIPRCARDYSLGSTAVTAYDDGTKKAELRYKAWGENRYTWGDTPTSFQYTGQRNDVIIGLLFYNARYYDASLGRFTQADTIVPQPENPQNLNRYSYVVNNPLAYIDPSGHWYYDPGTDALVHTGEGYNEQPSNLYYGPSPLATLWRLRQSDNPSCPVCSDITMIHILDEQWLEAHPGYSPDNDAFLARAEQTWAEGAGFNGLTPADVDDLRRGYSLLRTADQIAHGAGWEDLAIRNVVEFGPPLLGAMGLANSKLGSEAQQTMALRDYPTGQTKNWSAYFNSEGEARQLARQMLGHDPLEVEPGKWRSRDGRWQYRAKPGDVAGNHVHLEQLNPDTGEVLQNLHLRWPSGQGR